MIRTAAASLALVLAIVAVVLCVPAGRGDCLGDECGGGECLIDLHCLPDVCECKDERCVPLVSE